MLQAGFIAHGIRRFLILVSSFVLFGIHMIGSCLPTFVFCRILEERELRYLLDNILRQKGISGISYFV